jgi:hypothetical protein
MNSEIIKSEVVVLTEREKFDVADTDLAMT